MSSFASTPLWSLPSQVVLPYTEQTLSGTWSGPIAATAANVYCKRVGKICTLTIDSVNATGNNTAAIMTYSVAVPPAFLGPTAVNVVWPITCFANNAVIFGSLNLLTSTGVIVSGYGALPGTTYTSNAAATGIKPITVTYAIY